MYFLVLVLLLSCMKFFEHEYLNTSSSKLRTQFPREYPPTSAENGFFENILMIFIIFRSFVFFTIFLPCYWVYIFSSKWRRNRVLPSFLVLFNKFFYFFFQFFFFFEFFALLVSFYFLLQNVSRTKFCTRSFGFLTIFIAWFFPIFWRFRSKCGDVIEHPTTFEAWEGWTVQSRKKERAPWFRYLPFSNRMTLPPSSGNLSIFQLRSSLKISQNSHH